jgi:hypothetical protein
MASPIRDNPKLVSGISWRSISVASGRLFLDGAAIVDAEDTASMGLNDLAGGCD